MKQQFNQEQANRIAGSCDCSDDSGSCDWCRIYYGKIDFDDGCETCGSLDDINDNALCEDCQQSRNELSADMIHDQMKEGA